LIVYQKIGEFLFYGDEKVIEKVLVCIEPNNPKINDVLGNKYNNGSQYIGFHSESESDLHDNTFIVSVCLGTETYFVLTYRNR